MLSKYSQIAQNSFFCKILTPDVRINHYEPRSSEEGAAISLTTYPALNCLEQEDPELITALRNDVFYPPSEMGEEQTSLA